MYFDTIIELSFTRAKQIFLIFFLHTSRHIRVKRQYMELLIHCHRLTASLVLIIKRRMKVNFIYQWALFIKDIIKKFSVKYLQPKVNHWKQSKINLLRHFFWNNKKIYIKSLIEANSFFNNSIRNLKNLFIIFNVSNWRCCFVLFNALVSL